MTKIHVPIWFDEWVRAQASPNVEDDRDGMLLELSEIYWNGALSTGMTSEQIKYINDNYLDLVKAIVDGYEAHEPKYWVRDNRGYAMLRWANGSIHRASPFISKEMQWDSPEMYKFTKEEIKGFDVRYMAFAEEARE